MDCNTLTLYNKGAHIRHSDCLGYGDDNQIDGSSNVVLTCCQRQRANALKIRLMVRNTPFSPIFIPQFFIYDIPDAYGAKMTTKVCLLI